MIRRFPTAIAAATLALSLNASVSKAAEGEQLGQVAEQLKTSLAGAPVIVTLQDASVTLASSADAMFPSGGWQVPSTAPLLDKMLPTLSKLQNTKIVVGGYTDNVPIGSQLQTEGVSNNLDLSSRRAVSVANYLTSHGVNPALVSAKAFGETDRVASNDIPEGRAKNRRVDITLSVLRADEAQAKNLFKAMSDYLGAQKAISFEYDTNLEIVTAQKQKVGLASSGTVVLNRPDELHITRMGGFANVDMVFDGKTLTLLGKNSKLYSQVEAPGTIEHLVDVLRDKYHRPVPGADLLISDPYDELMPLVEDVKDLGSGVIRGTECDHLAFRTKDVDWQIWIAHGAHPYPCRYAITSPKVAGSPEYVLDIRGWKAGAEAAPDTFKLQIPPDAKKLNPEDVPDLNEIPGIFSREGAK
jgi:hypothetical protein